MAGQGGPSRERPRGRRRVRLSSGPPANDFDGDGAFLFDAPGRVLEPVPAALAQDHVHAQDRRTLGSHALAGLFVEFHHDVGFVGKFDDLEAESVDRVEEEADSFASEVLLPSSVWDDALARYVRSEESILSLADELQISPAVIAGRIRHEADNYVILSDLVGSGKVRRLFGDVEFGV